MKWTSLLLLWDCEKEQFILSCFQYCFVKKALLLLWEDAHDELFVEDQVNVLCKYRSDSATLCIIITDTSDILNSIILDSVPPIVIPPAHIIDNQSVC